MANLINFVTLLNGKFDNKDQFEKVRQIHSIHMQSTSIQYVIQKSQISQMVSKAYL